MGRLRTMHPTEVRIDRFGKRMMEYVSYHRIGKTSDSYIKKLQSQFYHTHSKMM